MITSAGEEFLPSIPLRGAFIQEGYESQLNEVTKSVIGGADGWRAGPRTLHQMVGGGGFLRDEVGGRSLSITCSNRANVAAYVVTYHHCAVAWVTTEGVWETAHPQDFCAAEQVRQVEAILAKAGIEWEEVS